MTDTIDHLFRLDGRNALVTGAASGIGTGIAIMLARAGAKVVAADMDAAAAAATAAQIEEAGGTAIPLTIDVTDEASINSAFAAAREALGGIDLLVNNAGIYPPRRLADLEAATFDRTIAINLRGPFLCTKAVIGMMGKGGAIVNIVSVDALRPSFEGLSHYGASKAGLIGFTRHTAIELAARGIRVNAVAPGGVDTPGAQRTLAMMDESQIASALRPVPLGRGGLPEDIAAAVLFLAGKGAAFITGQTLVVDGGTTNLG